MIGLQRGIVKISDFEKLDFKRCSETSVGFFFNVMNCETLGKKVSTAIRLKKQGHFNKAMLYLTEANRDQVLSIRQIQRILDKLENRDKTEIVFENYQQTLPLQIGLSNGKDVLELLDKIRDGFGGTLLEKTGALYQAEEDLDVRHEELIFFQERMQGRISSEELNDSKENVSRLAEKVYQMKKLMADTLIALLAEKYPNLVAEDRLVLTSNLYRIITSSIETKDSKLVKV